MASPKFGYLLAETVDGNDSFLVSKLVFPNGSLELSGADSAEFTPSGLVGSVLWTNIDFTGSTLADIVTRSASDLSSGTLPDARFPATLPAISGVNLTNLNASSLASGTLPAGRMPALTGDVTSSAGSVSTTIANNAVSLAKLADIATASFLGRNTAGTGDPEVLSVATAETMLGLSGTNSGDVTLAGETYLSLAGQVLTANQINLASSHVTNTLPSSKGGTGSTFFAVAGPSVLRTYTFPDANSTIARTDTGQTFTGTNNFQHILPALTDTYDLGSSIKLWRKGWLSELDAVLFAQNTVSVIGGWLIIGKGEGTIPVGQDVGAADTSIDFGQAMSANDFVLFRAALQVEYVQVVSLVSGTRYNVTRNVDGTGANAWVAGTVYLRLGNSGDGRIELNSNSTPRISLITQGSAYNAQTEILRIGDLNGSWGVSSETYGFAVGQYGVSGKSSLRIDDSGIRFFNNITERIRLLADGSGYLANSSIAWDTSGNLTVTGNATIAGWTVNSASFAKDTGTNSTSSGMAPTDFPFFAGATAANRATAPFRVTPAGALTATDATITGSITATSGTIAGWTVNSNRITSGSTHIASAFDVPAGEAAWFGQSVAGYRGWHFKDASGRFIQGIANNSTIYPYIIIHDGTRYRIALGAMNTTWGVDDTASSSMGMRVFNTSGNLLAEFSGSQNIISGWTIATTKISSTGIDINSGASAGLAFGTIPPSSATVGTGIWLDRTGLFGLASNTLQIKVDAATGKLIAGGNLASIGANGVEIVASTAKTSRDYRFVDALGGDYIGGTHCLFNAGSPAIVSMVLEANSDTDTTGVLINCNGGTSKIELKTSTTSGGARDAILINGGMVIGGGTPQGVGTLNVSVDIYKGSTAYTNPDFVFEHWATGKIERFVDNEDASTYKGLRPLSELREFVRSNYHLPGFGQGAGHGLFSGGDSLLASLEEAYIYIFELEQRIHKLECV